MANIQFPPRANSDFNSVQWQDWFQRLTLFLNNGGGGGSGGGFNSQVAGSTTGGATGVITPSNVSVGYGCTITSHYYSVSGKCVFFSCEFTVTGFSTANGYIAYALPIAANSTHPIFTGSGTYNGVAVNAIQISSPTQMYFNYSSGGTNVFNTAATGRVSGFYYTT